MGKYDSVLPGLKPLPAADPSYQDKVDGVKRLITDRDAFKLAQGYAVLRKGSGPPLSAVESEGLIKRLGKDGLKALASTCEVLVKAYEQLLEESQDAGAAGWGMFGVKDNALRLPSGETVRIQKEPYGKVIDKEKFRQWCVANGYETQLQLWPSTMNALVKERLMAGEAEPDGTEAFSYTEVQFVKAAEKKE